MCSLPGPEMEAMSPASQGWFLTHWTTKEIPALQIWYLTRHESWAPFLAQRNHRAFFPLILSCGSLPVMECPHMGARSILCWTLEDDPLQASGFSPWAPVCSANSSRLRLCRFSDLPFHPASYPLDPSLYGILETLKASSGATVGLALSISYLRNHSPSLSDAHCLENHFSCILSRFWLFHRGRKLR